MHWGQAKFLGNDSFRRLTGVKRSVFDRMVEILLESKSIRGRKRKLCTEDQLLMALEYIREYRTYFHIAQSYGVSESTAYKICCSVEDTLVKHPEFSLPGRKALYKSDMQYEVILVDATETPIERPKKNRNAVTQERRNDIL